MSPPSGLESTASSVMDFLKISPIPITIGNDYELMGEKKRKVLVGVRLVLVHAQQIK